MFHPEVPETDSVCAAETGFGGGVSEIGIATREPDRRRTFDERSRAYDDLDTAEVFGIASGGIHQGQERNPSCPGIRRTEAEFRWAALLGTGIFRANSGPR